MSYVYQFRMASGTATMVVIDPILRKVMIGVRAKTAWVYPGMNSMPGGFMEARYQPKGWRERIARWLSRSIRGFKLQGDLFHKGENLEETAQRELVEEAQLKVPLEDLHMFTVRSNSRTDTRAHVINACYWVEVSPEQIAMINAGDDLESIWWMDIADIYKVEPSDMAFNHQEIMVQGVEAWQEAQRIKALDAEVEDLRLAVWMVGNMDTPEDKTQWWKTFRPTWDQAASRMTKELASRVSTFSSEVDDQMKSEDA
jgi:ADP-ribose pyrophosphatase YjhB (NUDIX family)